MEEKSSERKLKDSKKGHQGLRSDYAALDEQVWTWYEKNTRDHQNLSKNDIQNYARTIYLEANLTSFKASDGWYRRWKGRWLKSGSIIKTRNELQASELDSIETFNLSLPDFDEHLYSIGRADSLLGDGTEIEDEAISKEECGKTKQTVKKKRKEKFNFVTNRRSINAKGKRYLPEFKEKVIDYAINHSFSASAVKFKVHPTTISSWMPDKKEVEEAELFFPETELCEWLKVIRLKGEKVNKNNVINKLNEIKEKPNWDKSKWFYQYDKRLNSITDNGTEKMEYPQMFKEQVVKLAELWSQKYVASILNISRKQIYNWSKQLHNNKIVKYEKSKVSILKDEVSKELWEWYENKALKPTGKELKEKVSSLLSSKGLLPTNWKMGYKNWFYNWCSKYNVSSNSILDKHLLEWILKKFDENVTPSHEMMRKKCRLLHKKIYGETSFKASAGWLIRFSKRYSSLLTQAPNSKIVLPGKCEEKKNQFKKAVKKLILDNQIALNQIGIMDESPLRFSKENPKHSMRLCSLKNIQGSFVLSYTASGNLLPLLLILKGPNASGVLCDENSDDVIVAYQQNGSMDDIIMKFWVDAIWTNCVPPSNVLILDCFEPHTHSSIKEKFMEHNNFLAVIPAGSASHFVFILSEISAYISQLVNDKWCNWLKNDANNFSDTSFKTLKSPSHSEIISWIRVAFIESKTKFQNSLAENFQNLMFNEDVSV